jgi:hypothetical protein
VSECVREGCEVNQRSGMMNGGGVLLRRLSQATHPQRSSGKAAKILTVRPSF